MENKVIRELEKRNRQLNEQKIVYERNAQVCECQIKNNLKEIVRLKEERLP